MAAYEDALSACSTEAAPWYVVPADRKWFRNLAIAETLVETLRPFAPGWLTTLEERGRTELARIQAARRAAEDDDGEGHASAGRQAEVAVGRPDLPRE